MSLRMFPEEISVWIWVDYALKICPKCWGIAWNRPRAQWEQIRKANWSLSESWDQVLLPGTSELHAHQPLESRIYTNNFFFIFFLRITIWGYWSFGIVIFRILNLRNFDLLVFQHLLYDYVFKNYGPVSFKKKSYLLWPDLDFWKANLNCNPVGGWIATQMNSQFHKASFNQN